jgi:hypothetical protein
LGFFVQEFFQKRKKNLKNIVKNYLKKNFYDKILVVKIFKVFKKKSKTFKFVRATHKNFLQKKFCSNFLNSKKSCKKRNFFIQF